MRGHVYRYRPGRDTRGHEQRGPRYAIVVQATDLHLSTVVIVPTSTACDSASFRPEVSINGNATRAMCEQVRAVDPQTRFTEYAGHLTHAEMQSIDTALRAVLTLD